jgi:hypothetical protein
MKCSIMATMKPNPVETLTNKKAVAQRWNNYTTKGKSPWIV